MGRKSRGTVTLNWEVVSRRNVKKDWKGDQVVWLAEGSNLGVCEEPGKGANGEV